MHISTGQTPKGHCPGDQIYTVPVKVDENVKLERIVWTNSDDSKEKSTCFEKVTLYFAGTTGSTHGDFMMEVCVEQLPSGGSEIKIREKEIVYSMTWTKEVVIIVAVSLISSISTVVCAICICYTCFWINTKNFLP